MPDGQLLEFSGVTKRFGAVTAVDAFTARVEPGQVTGFLGPNGAGKTTTLRILLGLVQATTGSATIGGVPYSRLRTPLQTVGAVLEASSFHPGRTGANHLRVYARAAGLPDSRVDEALGMVGLADVGGRKVGGYSLGMRQRLGLAYALLGDPGVLVLDEPANGLDPEGIKWMRGLLRELARQGRTVLVSSHLLAEVQQTVDSLLIIARGRLVFQGRLDELTDPSEYTTVVDSPDRAALAGALSAAGIEAEVLRSGLVVRGVEPVAVGAAAAAGGVALSGLQRRGPALEEVFLDLVNGLRVHASAADGSASTPGAVDGTAVAPVQDDAEAPVDAASPVAEEVQDAAPVDEGALDGAVRPDAAAGGLAGFVVASTGVIDIVPSVDPAPVETDAAAEQPEWAEPDSVARRTEPAKAESAAVADAPIADPPAAIRPRKDWWVPAEVKPLTSPIDVTETAAAAEGDAEARAETGAETEVETDASDAEDASDVAEGDEIEEIDAALERPDGEPGSPAEQPNAADEDAREAPTAETVPAPEPDESEAPASDTPADPDRPWERYVKTDADVEADRFFAAFDDSVGEPAADAGASAAEASADATPGEDDGSPAASDPGEADADADRERRDDEEGDQR